MRQCRLIGMALNKNLNQAKRNRKDEFYTRLEDIENELRHYKDHFKGKVVYCNCDDPTVSNFFKYFSLKFADFRIRKLITTCYRNQERDLFSQHESERAIMLEYDGFRDGERIPNAEDIGVTPLEGDGDFRSPECIEILKQADIIVTNPPFSLFREYVAQLMEHGKKFILIGPWNAVTYKEIFPAIRDSKFWLGYEFVAGNAYFAVPPEADMKEFAAGVYDEKTGLVKFRNVTWFTNLDHKKRHDDMIMFRRYTPEDYPHYDNYDAIEVNEIKNIPMNWAGVMGVPITFLDQHNPDQFEILGSNRGVDQDPDGVYGRGSYLNGKETFKRLFVRNMRPEKQV